MKYNISTFLFLLLALPGISQPIFQINGVAIRGYDPVAYFLDNTPTEGLAEYAATWQGVEWRFKSKANMDMFTSNPEKFAPQFGGFCAYGVSDNHKSPTDPSAFTVVNEKLYLNYSPKVKQLWSKDREMHIRRAETNWPALEHSKE
jgi:YHS domain-containing protein